MIFLTERDLTPTTESTVSTNTVRTEIKSILKNITEVIPRDLQNMFSNLTIPLTKEIRDDLQKFRKQITDFIERLKKAYREILNKPVTTTGGTTESTNTEKFENLS